MVRRVMSAVRLHTHTPEGPSGLVYEEIKTPAPAPGEVLVRVHAAAITRGELDWALDRLPATPSYEFSGTVAAMGPDVENISVDQDVYALSDFDREGAAADYTIVAADLLASK